MLGFWAEETLVAKVDADRAELGISRSQYMREALSEFLASHGYPVEAAEITAPDRTGKGGRPRKVDYAEIPTAAPELNESKARKNKKATPPRTTRRRGKPAKGGQ